MSATVGEKNESMPIYEHRAGLAAAKHIVRSLDSHHHNHLILGDSMCVALCEEKGRSSEFRMRRVCMQMCALSLATGSTFKFRWIPSELNPSDGLSRGSFFPTPAPSESVLRDLAQVAIDKQQLQHNQYSFSGPCDQHSSAVASWCDSSCPGAQAPCKAQDTITSGRRPADSASSRASREGLVSAERSELRADSARSYISSSPHGEPASRSPLLAILENGDQLHDEQDQLAAKGTRSDCSGHLPLATPGPCFLRRRGASHGQRRDGLGDVLQASLEAPSEPFTAALNESVERKGKADSTSGQAAVPSGDNLLGRSDGVASRSVRGLLGDAGDLHFCAASLGGDKDPQERFGAARQQLQVVDADPPPHRARRSQQNSMNSGLLK